MLTDRMTDYIGVIKLPVVIILHIITARMCIIIIIIIIIKLL